MDWELIESPNAHSKLSSSTSTSQSIPVNSAPSLPSSKPDTSTEKTEIKQPDMLSKKYQSILTVLLQTRDISKQTSKVSRVFVQAHSSDTVLQLKEAVLKTALIKEGSEEYALVLKSTGRMTETESLSVYPELFVDQDVHAQCVELYNFYNTKDGVPLFLFDVKDRGMCLYLPLSADVQQLKYAISVAWGINEEKQRIIWNGTALIRGRLDSHGIKSNNAVMLLLSQTGN